MREVITLQIGHFGNLLGSMFWEDLYEEHKISKSGHINYADCQANSFPEVFLSESLEDIHHPRAVIVDTDPSTIRNISCFPESSLVSKDSQVFGISSTQRNFASGRSEKAIISKVLDNSRKQLEKCESPQGFQFFHSIGGGNGSGLMREVLIQLYEDDPSKNFVNFAGFPSSNVSELPQETINACLAMNSLVECSNLCVCLDNGKLFDSVSRIKEFEGFSEINSIIRQQVSDFTSFLRFPGSYFSTYQKIEAFLSPFIRLHFFMMNSSCAVPGQNDEIDMMMQTLNPSNVFYQNDLENSRTYASVLLSRGVRQDNEMRAYKHWLKSNRGLFVNWLKTSSKFHSIESSNFRNPKSFSYIHNSQNIRNLFLRLDLEFTELIKGKVQIERYLKLGMDEMEFFESERNLSDLCSEYRPDCFTEISEDEEENECDEEEI